MRHHALSPICHYASRWIKGFNSKAWSQDLNQVQPVAPERQATAAAFQGLPKVQLVQPKNSGFFGPMLKIIEIIKRNLHLEESNGIL